MSFPPRPETDDECRTELLRLMEVPGHPRLYVLGCFARYVTVYAQQVRAFNLVDTLAKSGVLTPGSEVAVLGGGIAGLTAAAAAAVRGVRSVSVFEKEANTMRLQRGTEKRFIHPHIYDWPTEEALKEQAGHDLLDWEAGIAADVIQKLDGRWQDLRKRYQALQPPLLGCRSLDVKPDGKRWTVLVEKKPAGTFDVAILAVGFGRDSTRWSEGYWTDTSLDGLEAESAGSWFVSGYGDGGLTDLMRLCIMDFRHQEKLKEVLEAVNPAVGKDLLAAEGAGLPPEKLAETFLDAARRIKPTLDAKLRLRKLGKVSLNCSSFPKLFSGPSSLLNRLIVAYLSLDNRFSLVENGGDIATIRKTRNRKHKVIFKNRQEPLEVDRVVLRHGPSKALPAGFSWVSKKCEDLEQEWKNTRQHEDWTREPLYSPGDFEPGSPARLRVDFRPRIGCIVITGSRPPAGQTQPQRIEGALESLKKLFSDRFMGPEIQTKPEHISVAEALASPATYEWTVRALCDSEIAVFDITGFESAVMLFLGIRSAVRRGITLTISQDNDAGQLLPFNLAALNPILLGEKKERENITRALETGLASLSDQPEAYLDLPAFDPVRNLGNDYGPLPPETQVLVLRWFDKQYNKLVRDLTENAVIAIAGANPPVVTTLDSSSPQLVSQRLYAAIRRTDLCIADWTGWRPNVFFEMGVRLAVNKIDPVCILCREQPPGWKDVAGVSEWPASDDPHAAALKDFFNPVLFTFKEGYGAIRDRIQKHLSQREFSSSKLSPGRTYQVICESISRDLEPGGKRVEEMLMSEAVRIAGPVGPEKGGSPLLYSDVLADQARHSSVEMLLAAWHYLDRRDARGRLGLIDRLKKGKLKPNDPVLASLHKVGAALCARLLNIEGDEYQKIAAKIDDVLTAIEKNETRQKT